MPSQNKSDYKSNSGGGGGNGGFGAAVAQAFKDVSNAFGGGSAADSSGGDVRRAEDRAANQPSYSAFSVRGLTSSDPANVARNQAAAERYAAQSSMMGGSNREATQAEAAAGSASLPRNLGDLLGNNRSTPRGTPRVRTPTPTPPAAPAPVVPGDMTSTGAAETAALESTKKGLASTIATSAKGLLAEEEPLGLLRRRRSIMGGGLIQ